MLMWNCYQKLGKGIKRFFLKKFYLRNFLSNWKIIVIASEWIHVSRMTLCHVKMWNKRKWQFCLIQNKEKLRLLHISMSHFIGFCKSFIYLCTWPGEENYIWKCHRLGVGSPCLISESLRMCKLRGKFFLYYLKSFFRYLIIEFGYSVRVLKAFLVNRYSLLIFFPNFWEIFKWFAFIWISLRFLIYCSGVFCSPLFSRSLFHIHDTIYFYFIADIN